jgi:hypothetical protein
MVFRKVSFSRKYSQKSHENLAKIFAKTKNPLNLTVIRRKYENFRANAKNFAKISLRKLALIAESLLMWNTWGMGHQIEYFLLKYAF